MKVRASGILVLLVFSLGAVAAQGQPADQTSLGQKASEIIKKNCSVSGCHAGRHPTANLNMEPGKFPATVVDVPSSEKPPLKIVDSSDPEKSYLLMKIKGSPGIAGGRMPLSRSPLPADQISTLGDWVKSLQGAVSEAGANATKSGQEPPKASPNRFEKPAFWGTRLINLPTGSTVDKGHLLFQVSHRFVPEVDSGYDFFFGLDGPAHVLLGLGFGLTDNLSVFLSRANYYKEVEVGADWRFLDAAKSGPPVSAAIHVSGSFVTQSSLGAAIIGQDRFKFNSQLSVSYQIDNRLSLLLVPAYSSNTDHWDTPSQGTLALGFGGRWMFLDDFSLVAEWMPILSGYKDAFSGFGIGFEKKIGGHVFQVFFHSSTGLTSDQFLPGGDLNPLRGSLHFGFNIFRTF